MNVATAVARALVACGIDHVFGLIGSGNFHLTNALVGFGARYVAAVHEAGAATMADAFARVSGRLCAVSVHQGPGVTNALTGIAEAAKSRTPLIVLAPEATNPRSNFFVDLPGLAASIGAGFRRVRAEHAVGDAISAVRDSIGGAGQTVVLGLPLDVQAMAAGDAALLDSAGNIGEINRAGTGATNRGDARVRIDEPLPAADDASLSALVAALAASQRPVFIAGRGASRGPAPRISAVRDALIALADRTGALLAVSAAARGLFAGDPWYLDISGGFASPLTAELVSDADLIVAWGSTLNMWTTRHGKLVSPNARIAQVDLAAGALGIARTVDVAVRGDLLDVARRSLAALAPSTGYRTPALRDRIAAHHRWRDVPFVDDSTADHIDARTLTIALDDTLPAARTVVVDSGNFMGYPAMLLSIPDSAGFCFTQAFQSIGLGLASALGASLARPDRLTVAALGDGGFLMSSAELATAATLGTPLVIVIYNDAAYGAEVHHFGPEGHPTDLVRFADRDLAAIARGFGCAAATVRKPDDLSALHTWLAGPRDRPLVLDAKVTSSRASWWLEEAFRGH